MNITDAQYKVDLDGVTKTIIKTTIDDDLKAKSNLGKAMIYFNNDDIQSLYNGEELLFLWDRTISRIEEMRDINDK